MWRRREEEEQAQKQAFRPAPGELAREGIPMQTSPPRPMEPEIPRGMAYIGKSVHIKGQIFGREDLFVDGEVEGTLELPEHKLTIGPNGKLSASIKAREVVVSGTVQGDIQASDKIDIRKDARLVGDIRTSRIVIEDGAYFKGSIDIQRPEVKPAAQPRPVQAAQAAAAAPAATASVPANSPETRRQDKQG